MDREKLLNQIMEQDFMVLDLRLYLNTHPTDKEAISHYNKHMTNSRKLRAEFEKMYGSLSQSDMSNNNEFSWIDNPWPWEKTYLYGESYIKGEQ